MARGIFRLRLPDGTVRLARGTPETGPTDLLPADATVESLLRAGPSGARRSRRRGRGRRRGSGRRDPSRPDRQPGGLGRGRHVRAIAGRPDGGGGRAVDLRPRLRRRAAGGLLQGRRLARPRTRPSRSRVRADSAWNAPEPEFALVLTPDRRDRRLHDRQRRLVARDRGREPALPAAGEDLRRLVRDRAGDRARERGRAAGRDPARGRPRRRRHRRRGDLDRPPPPDASTTCSSTSAGRCRFPHGAFLLTGTGIVAGPEFSLSAGDVCRIEMDGLGVLENLVESVGERPRP